MWSQECADLVRVGKRPLHRSEEGKHGGAREQQTQSGPRACPNSLGHIVGHFRYQYLLREGRGRAGQGRESGGEQKKSNNFTSDS